MVEPGERGATRIADRVVAKIASQAAREALSGPWPSSPHATVTVRDRVARVKVVLELRYPSDVGAQCIAVRRRVTERVKVLADMQVPEVAVSVERLHSSQLDRGRVR